MKGTKRTQKCEGNPNHQTNQNKLIPQIKNDFKAKVPHQSVGMMCLIAFLELECRLGKAHDKEIRPAHSIDL